MSRRALLAVGLVVALASAGCTGGVFGGIPEDRLYRDTAYDWDTDADATYRLYDNGNYTAVYDVNASTLELYRTDGLGNEQPLRIQAVAFRYENGTVADDDAIEVRTTRRRTIVDFPASEGQFAYTAAGTPKRFSTRTFVDGSYEVVLPENREVSNPLFGSVQPAGYEVDRSGDRVRIRWSEVRANSIVVQYYLERDVTLFFALVGVAGLGALAGVLYYYRLIQRLQERRREAGLDVDVDDDEFDDGPPPGLR